MPEEAVGHAPSAAAEKLHLDEVTGKLVSKSELKRLQKQREAEEKKQIRAAGRIWRRRDYGAGLKFLDLQGLGVDKVQVMCQAQEAVGRPFEEQHEHLERGDFVGVIGYPGRTAPRSGQGEVSIFVQEVV